MEAPPKPNNEIARLRALAEYRVLDTPTEEGFDALTRLAAHVMGVPIALVSLVDADRQWFKSRYGLDVPETPRDVSFCGHVVANDAPLVVADAHADARFADNPLVVGAPKVRFYAGFPLRTPDGFVLGTLCAIDHEPHVLSEDQQDLLRLLAGQVVALLELRRKERLLAAESEALSTYVEFFRLSLDLFCTADQTLHFRAMNASWENVLGWTRDELRARPFTALVHPDDLAATIREAGRLNEDGARTVNFENRYRHRDGHWVPLSWTATVRGDLIFASARDMTQYRDKAAALAASEQALGQERAFLGAVLDEMPGSVVAVFDTELHVVRLFGGGAAFDGPRSTAGTLALASVFESREIVEAARRSLLGEAVRVELLHQGRRFEARLVGWTSAGERRGLLLAYDVTERDALREQLSRQERLVTTGTLAAGVGHEINNPLAYVLTNIDVVLEELRAVAGLSPSTRLREMLEALGEAREGADRIRRIVRGLRAFAREDGVAAPCDVHATLEISANMAMHEVRQKATLVTDSGKVPPVFADEARLSQVFVNLIVNAAQAFPKSDPATNRIVVRTGVTRDGLVSLEVSDNGPGITPDALPRIFDPFFTTKPVGVGTGLGLSICHNVVTSLGGRIECETELGSGTTFRVFLPAADETASSDEGATFEYPGPRGRVLVIDDEEVVLRSIVRLLKQEHEVIGVKDSREAITRLVDRQEHFDVVFCDIMMPNITGMEVFQRVRASRPALASRFVFITGGVTYDDVRAFLGEVENERLEKPFSSQNLRGVARRYAGTPS